MDVFAIIIAALFADNFVLSQFLGICPFLGVSKKISSATGMGLAVTAVMVITCVVCYPIYTFLLAPMGLQYLRILVFILVIASLVQILEMVLRRFSPGLYSAMGIYLPLVTTNCAILGIAKIVTETTDASKAGYIFSDVFFGKLVNVNMVMGYGEAVLSGLFYGLGFTLAIVLLAGLRTKTDKLQVAKPMRGFPITMLAACFMAMAFYLFTI